MRSLLTAALVLVADQTAKWLVISHLPPGRPVPVIPGLFSLTFTRNPGAAFGLLPDRAPFFVVTALLLIAGVVYYLRKAADVPPATAVALGLAAGGAAGNLVDRLRWGTVVDFLDLHVWPVFNLADAALVAGGVLLAWTAARTGRD